MSARPYLDVVSDWLSHDLVLNIMVQSRLVTDEYIWDPLGSMALYVDGKLTTALSREARNTTLQKILKHELSIEVIRKGCTKLLDVLVLRQLHTLDLQECRDTKLRTVAKCEHRNKAKEVYQAELKELTGYYNGNALLKFTPGKLLQESLDNGKLKIPKSQKRAIYALDEALLSLRKLKHRVTKAVEAQPLIQFSTTSASNTILEDLKEWESYYQEYLNKGWALLQFELARGRCNASMQEDARWPCERCSVWRREDGLAWITRYSPQAPVAEAAAVAQRPQTPVSQGTQTAGTVQQAAKKKVKKVKKVKK